MNHYIIGPWRDGKVDEWWEKVQGNVYRSEAGRYAFRHAITIRAMVDAETMDDAKIKWTMGTGLYKHINKGKCAHDPSLTEGDRTAVQRAVSRILRQLSDEAIEFLLVTGGVVPSLTADERLQQLRKVVVGTS